MERLRKALEGWTIERTHRATRKRAKNDLLQLKRCDSFVNHSSRSILKMDQWRWKIRRSLIQICRKELKVSSPPPLSPLPHITITCYILFACLWVRDPFNILLLLEMIFFLTQLPHIRKRIETEKQKKTFKKSEEKKKPLTVCSHSSVSTEIWSFCIVMSSGCLHSFNPITW